MAVDSPAGPQAEGASDEQAHLVRLSAYVDLPLQLVFERLGELELDALLTRAAVGLPHPELSTAFETGVPVWESGTHVHFPVSWTVTGPRRAVTGRGAVSFLAVRGGRSGVTEVLADLTVTQADERDVARITRRVLDEMTRLLETGR
ncbi:MAG: hypothetical protein ACLGI8_03030 [Acidimicrobiia bacterium]|jgi:hypothetical protein